MNSNPTIISEAGNYIANSAIFAILGAVISLILLAKQYFESIFDFSQNFPRVVALSYLVGGWLLAYLLIFWGILMQPISTIEHLWRSAFTFCGILLSFGPFLIFTPMRQIVVKQRALKKIVEAVQKKETRYVAFGLFCIITLLQGFVGYSLYGVLASLNIAIEQIIFSLVAYALIVLYYLIAFYDAMMKKPIIIRGVNLLEQLRKNLIISWRTIKIEILQHPYFVKLYIFLFIIALAASFGVTIYVLYAEISNFSNPNFTLVAKVLVICFGVVNFITALVLVIYVGNVAFRPYEIAKYVKLENGTEVELQIKAFSLAKRKTRESLFTEFPAQLDENSREEIDKELRTKLLTVSNEEGYEGEWDYERGKFFQQNDSSYMYFLCSHSDFPTTSGFHFIHIVRSELKEKEDYIFNPSNDVNLKQYFGPFLQELFVKFSNPDYIENLETNFLKEKKLQKSLKNQEFVSGKLNFDKKDSKNFSKRNEADDFKNDFSEMELKESSLTSRIDVIVELDQSSNYGAHIPNTNEEINFEGTNPPSPMNAILVPSNSTSVPTGEELKRKKGGGSGRGRGKEGPSNMSIPPGAPKFQALNNNNNNDNNNTPPSPKNFQIEDSNSIISSKPIIQPEKQKTNLSSELENSPKQKIKRSEEVELEECESSPSMLQEEISKKDAEIYFTKKYGIHDFSVLWKLVSAENNTVITKKQFENAEQLIKEYFMKGLPFPKSL